MLRLPSLSLKHNTTGMPRDEGRQSQVLDARLHRRTLLKLDCLLLPFLALLFLFNALDKANIGNAESAHFSADIGLRKGDVNTAVVLFFIFFVTLQPVGAALGRKYGMVAWVPSCMLLWGVSTALHAWVRHAWQLYTLRILIGCLEAGFYPITVTYLSQFYTRFEFGRRLSLFYGQAAIGGALGGIISYLVFSRFHDDADQEQAQATAKWRSWQVLFLLEGSMTIIVAFAGYFWLPHSVETAWFLTPEERAYTASRVVRDRDDQNVSTTTSQPDDDEEREYDEESRGLLNPSRPAASTLKDSISLHDRGLTPRDLFSAVFNTKIWHILTINILSAVPVYAFAVFLPLVLAPLMKKDNPAIINLLTAPPHICGVVTLYLFARYSDKHQKRLVPVLYGLAIMVAGFVIVVILPTTWAIPRYLALNILLSGTYVASPLTVVWISGNTPSPGKRALLLGINGWGNLAGVLAALLYRPRFASSGYIVPLVWTLVCIAISAAGYLLFYKRLQNENAFRQKILGKWSEEDVERERAEGKGPFPQKYQWLKGVIGVLRANAILEWLADWLEEVAESGREGDEKMTFFYGL